MKYKIRYTAMALVFCSLLGWDLAYEYEQPGQNQTVTPHPTVHTLTHLIAPAYKPRATPVEAATEQNATSTVATTTPLITATTTPVVSTSTEPKTATTTKPKPIITLPKIRAGRH